MNINEFEKNGKLTIKIGLSSEEDRKKKKNKSPDTRTLPHQFFPLAQFLTASCWDTESPPSISDHRNMFVFPQ